MTLAVASERSIFRKNHDCNSYIVFRVAVNTYAPIFRGVDARSGRLYKQTHTHTHTRDSHSDDNKALQLNRYNTTYSVYVRMQNRST